MLFNLLNFVSDYYSLLAITLLLGILAGMIVILINVCLCEYLGKNKASLAFGLSAFFCGLATLARPNLVGYFRDIQGSYNGLFSLLSMLCYAASVIWLCEIVVTKMNIKQKLSGSNLPPIDRRLWFLSNQKQPETVWPEMQKHLYRPPFEHLNIWTCPWLVEKTRERTVNLKIEFY